MINLTLLLFFNDITQHTVVERRPQNEESHLFSQQISVSHTKIIMQIKMNFAILIISERMKWHNEI